MTHTNSIFTHYPYRWWYVFMIITMIFIISYYYDIQPKRTALSALHAQQMQLAKKISILRQQDANNKKNSPPPPSLPSLPSSSSSSSSPSSLLSSAPTQPQWLSYLLQTTQLAGIQIISLQEAPKNTIHFSAYGNFQQWIHFMNLLSKDNLLVLDFSYKISRQNRYVFTADILFFPGLPRFVNNTITIAALTSPFCSTVESLPSKQTQKSFQFTAIPLDPLRIVGRIQQGQRAQALVTLPDNTTVAVNIRK